MFVVPTSGPEVDLCRQCQMVWFDAGELDDTPRRTAREMMLDDFAVEKREFRKRRDRHWDQMIWISRHPIGGIA